MDRQEPPPPRQRHRVPHHRRHRHHHNQHSATQTTNGKPALSLGRLNRESHAPHYYSIVESWLGQLTAPVSTSLLVSPGAQNLQVHYSKRRSSQDENPLHRSEESRRVDPLWRPQHIPLTQGFSPPRFPALVNRGRDQRRYKRNSGDSSLISGSGAHQELRDLDYIETTPECNRSQRHRPRDEVKVDIIDASSPKSHRTITSEFARRPRHKTKADKYDTKKSGARKRKGTEPHRPRRRKSNKRGAIATGKNVMTNFTSEAVLNDRITTNLKPGLFGNKRIPKQHLITDLSFSEMQLPKHQERELPQQKGISNSRLSERRRESRELEQISSFFLPARTNGSPRKEKPGKFKDSKKASSERLCSRDDKMAGLQQDSFVAPSSAASMNSHRQRSPRPPGNSRPVPTATDSNPDCAPSSSGTTYFTWSSSRGSLQAGQGVVVTQPMCIDPARSVTPENVREALVATGVYKDTGICSSGALDSQQNIAEKTCDKASLTRSTDADYVKHCEKESLGTESRRPSSAEAAVAPLAHLESRWNTILPPEWRQRRPSKVEIPPADEEQGADTAIISRPLSRHGMVERPQATSMQDTHQHQHVCRHSNYDSRASSHTQGLVPILLPSEVCQMANHPTIADESPATISPREAMPPPPVPRARVGSLHSTSPKPGGGSFPFTCLESVRPFGTHAQTPNCEHECIIDTDRVTGQAREFNSKPEKLFPAFDSASWIPQAVTSDIVSYERDKTLSRLSMRSPIYNVQGQGNGAQCTLRSPLSPATHITESMADFIARIESELGETTSLNEDRRPVTMVGSREFCSEEVINNDETRSRQLTASSGLQTSHRQPAVDVTDLGFREVFGTDYEELAAAVGDRSTTMSTECSGDGTDEFLEMSKFWRPNRFSYF